MIALTYTQKRCTLAHELVHWAYGDSACDPLYHSREEHRALTHASVMLINPVEYQLAEEMYDGNLLMIALELDVTPQVVKDYRDYIMAMNEGHDSTIQDF